MLGGEGLDVGRARDGCERWDRLAQLREPATHHQLVLGVAQRVRPGVDGDTVGDQGLQVLVRDVLVVEGERLRPDRHAAQGVEVAVIAEDDVRADQRGGLVGADREHP